MVTLVPSTIPIIPRFQYPSMDRITREDGVRHYVCPESGLLLPSVTTILDATADKTALKHWERRVGITEANRVRKEATNLGSLMHAHLEAHVQNLPRPPGNNLIHQMANRMADTVIGRALHQVREIWAMEVPLRSPGLYAGTTDLIGVFNGKPAIMDYKTTRAHLKSKEQIGDYACQLAAYATAHNEVYGTDIKSGVIFMTTRDCAFRQYVFEGEEFQRATVTFLSRLETYVERQMTNAAEADATYV